MEPQRPTQVSAHAEACLRALSASGLGRTISLGDALGLAHYLEYRATHDVDAWWMEPATQDERREVVRILERALEPYGEVRTRSWGDVVSVELRHEGKAVFGFEIARRSALLDQPVSSPWPGIRLDRLTDLIASKMSALVERGAPRDFRDVYSLCERGLADPARCWELWKARQDAAGEDADPRRAELAIRSHLARIEQARPLSGIAQLEQRAAAEKTRAWFTKELLRELPD